MTAQVDDSDSFDYKIFLARWTDSDLVLYGPHPPDASYNLYNDVIDVLW